MKNGLNPTVLVIDDSVSMREITTDMLHLLDLEVLTAQSGEEGVTIYNQNSIDLVLLDMNMPIMDGAATYRALRKLNPDVSVVVCTSEPKAKVKIRFGEMAMPAYLHKPFDTHIFLDIVQAMLGKRSSLSHRNDAHFPCI